MHLNSKELDAVNGREWRDEGVYPSALGCYHMYHRIDGKLVAVGAIDLT